MTGQKRRQVMNHDGMERTLNRMISQIVEDNPDLQDLILVGIQTRGVPLARRIHQSIPESLTGMVDITFYRDDLTIIASNPVVHKTEIPVSIEGKRVILVDDVLFTGRTVRAAIDTLMDYGRPSSIQLAVLVDRGHRELPIQADFVGTVLPTEKDELVEVMVSEVDGEDGIWIINRRDYEE